MQLCRNIEDMPDMAETSGEKRDHLVDRAIQSLFGDHTLLLAGEEYDPNDDPSRSASDDLDEDDLEDDEDEIDED